MKHTQQAPTHDPSALRHASAAHYHSSIDAFTTPSDRKCDLACFGSLAEAVAFTGIPAEQWIATHPLKPKKHAKRSKHSVSRSKPVNIWEQLKA